MTDAVSHRLKALQDELDDLQRHTHGFAYPDCPKCARIQQIEQLFTPLIASEGERADALTAQQPEQP